jgi:hypothetical protein
MKYCQYCGYKLKDDAINCPNCGRDVSNDSANITQVYYVNNAINGYAIAGFIFSLFIPLLGLIFGVIGLSKSEELGGEGRGFAIGALVISGLYFLGCLISLIVFVVMSIKYR